MLGSTRRLVIGWAAVMAAFFAGALWFAFATDRYETPPPSAGRPPLQSGAPGPYRHLERPEITLPESAFKQDVLFNNNQM
jgi:hypothetical protein